MLKRKIENKFRDLFLRRLGFFEMESSVIMPGKVFEASGHVDHFKEPMVNCEKCNRSFRADHLLQEFAGMSDTETEKLNLQELMNWVEKKEISCPECGGPFHEPKQFLTMFTTTIGPYSEALGYGRPEAAQGIFVEFRRLYECARGKFPFAFAQIGRALRNEISPRQGPIRLREFTIIDMELFFDPEEPQCPVLKDVETQVLTLIPAQLRLKGEEKPVDLTVKEALSRGYIKTEWLAYFMALSKRFLCELGIPEEKQRFIEKLDWEKAHYSAQGYDQEIRLDRWGWVEVSGHNYRTSYDLQKHMESSGVDMKVFKKLERPRITDKLTIKPRMAKMGHDFKGDAPKIVKLLNSVDPEEIQDSFTKNGYYMLETYKILPEQVEIIHEKVKEIGKRFVPHVVEPSFGSDRLAYATLEYAYKIKEGRTMLSFPRDVAPIQVNVFPLVSKDGLPKIAEQVYRMLIDEGFRVEYDAAGSIGRRYARSDEIGTPLGITIDYQTKEEKTVTVRDRDTWGQVRTRIEELPELLRAFFHYSLKFKDLGQPLNG